jgi:hypothetical protein
VNAIAWNSNGSLLASGSDDTRVSSKFNWLAEVVNFFFKKICSCSPVTWILSFVSTFYYPKFDFEMYMKL